MKRFLILFASLLITPLLASCASGGSGAQSAETDPGDPHDTSIRETDDVRSVSLYEGEPFSSEIIQKAIDDCPPGGVVYIPEGTYKIKTAVSVKSDITIRGDGEKTVLLCDRTLAETDKEAAMLAGNSVSRVAVEDLVFDGDLIDDRNGPLLSFGFSDDISILNCTFRNNRRIAVTCGGCRNVFVSFCTFRDNGLPKPSTISTPAFWTDTIMDTKSENVTIEDSVFENNNWSGCYFMPDGGAIRRCRFIDNGESTIFVNGHGNDLEFTDNYITGARMSNISCTGIEIGGSRVRVTGNLIENCGASGVCLTDTADAEISGNMLLNNGQETAEGWGASVFLYSLGTDSTVGFIRNVVIRDNVFADYKGYPFSTDTGIGIWKRETGTPLENVTVTGNTYLIFPKGLYNCYNAAKVSDAVGESCSFDGNTRIARLTADDRQAFIDAQNKRIEEARAASDR